ncbi:hypothetical protein [Cetobacterium sp.]|uniref:hypothetical protein n=1 Tax=Cetobacterium sp. TaxID=2071632 RepID=UPI003EE807F1
MGGENIIIRQMSVEDLYDLKKIEISEYLDLYLEYLDMERLIMEETLYSLSRNFMNCFEKKISKLNYIKILREFKQNKNIIKIFIKKRKKNPPSIRQIESIPISTVNYLIIDCIRVLRI